MSIRNVLAVFYLNKAWSLDGETYAGLDWKDQSAKPSEETLLGLATKANTYLAAKAELERIGLQLTQRRLHEALFSPTLVVENDGQGQPITAKQWYDARLAQIETKREEMRNAKSV